MSHERILKFWFNRVEETITPSEKHARAWWFGESEWVDRKIAVKFSEDLGRRVTGGQNMGWEKGACGRLAFIIMLDQFSRYIYREFPKAFTQGGCALSICINGIKKQENHKLNLIERIFYYFPLLHSENLDHRKISVCAYKCPIIWLHQKLKSFTKAFLNSLIIITILFGALVSFFGQFL